MDALSSSAGLQQAQQAVQSGTVALKQSAVTEQNAVALVERGAQQAEQIQAAAGDGKGQVVDISA